MWSRQFGGIMVYALAALLIAPRFNAFAVSTRVALRRSMPAACFH